MATKEGENTTFTIGENGEEKEFTIRHPGVKWVANHLIDETPKDRQGNPKIVPYCETVLKNLVQEPQDFKINDFYDMDEMQEFMEKTQSFL